MIHQLYQLITQPFSFIQTEKEASLGKLSILCILLASFCSASEANGLLTSALSLTLICAAIYATMLFLQSVTIDFFAQWLLKTEAKSLKLFQWFSITLLPFTLWIPLELLESSGKAAGLFSLIKFGTLILILAEQISILKAQYTLTTKRSIFLYLLPLLFMIASFFALAFVIALLG